MKSIDCLTTSLLASLCLILSGCSTLKEPPSPPVLAKIEPAPIACTADCPLPDALPDGELDGRVLTKDRADWMQWGACQQAGRMACVMAWPK